MTVMAHSPRFSVRWFTGIFALALFVMFGLVTPLSAGAAPLGIDTNDEIYDVKIVNMGQGKVIVSFKTVHKSDAGIGWAPLPQGSPVLSPGENGYRHPYTPSDFSAAKGGHGRAEPLHSYLTSHQFVIDELTPGVRYQFHINRHGDLIAPFTWYYGQFIA